MYWILNLKQSKSHIIKITINNLKFYNMVFKLKSVGKYIKLDLEGKYIKVDNEIYNFNDKQWKQVINHGISIKSKRKGSRSI